MDDEYNRAAAERKKPALIISALACLGGWTLDSSSFNDSLLRRCLGELPSIEDVLVNLRRFDSVVDDDEVDKRALDALLDEIRGLSETVLELRRFVC